MGLTYSHALGRERKFFAKTESTAGTAVKPATTDAAKVVKSSFVLEQSQEDRGDSRQTASQQERVVGKAKVSWSVDSELIPSGSAGTAPDLHPLFLAAMGSTTNSPGVHELYSLSDSQTAITTLSMYHEFSSTVQEVIWGAWVDELKLSASGGDVVKAEFAGGAMGYSACGVAPEKSAYVADDQGPDIEIETTDTNAIGVHSVIRIGSDTYSGAGWWVTNRNGDIVTVDNTLLQTFTGETLYPYLPTETTAGSPLIGISGSVSFGGVSFVCTAIELTLKNNLRETEDEVFREYTNDVVRGFRQVTGSLTFRWRSDRGTSVLNRKAYTQSVVSVVFGSVAGRRVTLSMPRVEIDFSGFEFPAEDEAIVSLPFTALAVNGADELTIKFH